MTDTAATATPLAGRIALVTGASRGLGFALSVELARAGAHVVALARTVGGLEALDDAIRDACGDQAAATLVPADITKLDPLDRLGAQLYERFGKLDLLVLNAGMLGALSPVAQGEKPLWQNVFATNLFGPQRLLRSLDPLLAAARRPQVVGVTCAAAGSTDAYWGAYAASKGAFETMLLAYAAETAGRGGSCWLADPGAMGTRLRRAAFPGEDEATQPRPEAAAAWLVQHILTGVPNAAKRSDCLDGQASLHGV